MGVTLHVDFLVVTTMDKLDLLIPYFLVRLLKPMLPDVPVESILFPVARIYQLHPHCVQESFVVPLMA